MPKQKRSVRKVPVKRAPPAAAATMERVKRLTLWLGCVFPVEAPIRVTWGGPMLAENLGQCSFNRKTKSFEIRLRRRLSAEVALSTLIHEWAHARTMLGMQDGEDFHSARFWTVMGEIENAWNAGGNRAAARLSL